MMRTLLKVTLPALLSAPLTTLAAHPLVTDDTGTQGDRRYQLELTAEHGRDESSVGGLTAVDVGGEAAVAFAVGVGEPVDVVIGLPTAWSRSRVGGALVAEQVGLSDASLEVKWRFFEREGFSAAVKPGLTLPVGDPREGLGSGRPGYGLTLIASQEVGPVALHLNGGWSRADFLFPEDAAASRRDTYAASLAAAVEVAPGLQLVADLGVESPGERGATTWPAFALVGAAWSVTDRFDLDVGVRTALNAADTDLVVLGGAAWRFGGGQ
jgi:hypothetical protein